jgi:hypothetical protein
VKAEHWLGDIPDWCDPAAGSPATARRQAAIDRRAQIPAPTSRLSDQVSAMLSKLRAALIKISNPGQK